eukprot:TRINITY_DN695_c0_g1_i1.p1 TRINITY_DN695_c0_g1~~TRINITY_DN695_c0_g1_i1.p1  ORF type:complete len:300 (-),score=48.90 TRINITY_DN695_c0_g1_i1:159-1058(-)
MSLDIRLNRSSRIFYPKELVKGSVVISSQKPLSHQELRLNVEGKASLQVSAKSMGMMESLYNNVQPVDLMKYEMVLDEGGKFPTGKTEIPFQFELIPTNTKVKELFETYHGVYVNVQYKISVLLTRGRFSKNLERELEFYVLTPRPSKPELPPPVEFVLDTEKVKSYRHESRLRIPEFRAVGKVNCTLCNVELPFTGEITIETCEAPLKSVEVQLVRVETVLSVEGKAREATEIQNVQIGDGDICRGVTLPIHMVFPRLFTCSTLLSTTFRVEFEVNVVLQFEGSLQVTENFPIRLYRC